PLTRTVKPTPPISTSWPETFSPERNTRVAFSCACVLTTSASTVAAARIVRLNICNLLNRLHKLSVRPLFDPSESAADEPDQISHPRECNREAIKKSAYLLNISANFGH